MALNQALFLLLVALAVAILPGISRIIRLPVAVTEILFGVLLGESFLQLQFAGEWLSFLAHLGFLVLMFHSGMEIDFGVLLRQSWKQFLFHLLVFGFTLTLSFGFAWLIGKGIFVGLVLATTSLGIVMPTLREAGLSRTSFGQNLLVASSLADFLTLLGITFYVLGSRYGFTWQIFSPLLLFIGFALLLWVGRLWAWWNPQQAERMLATGDSLELGVRFSLALLFFFVAISELVQLEPVLGAFMGGCVLSFVLREKTVLEGKISALVFGFLIPIFFIHVGMQFDLANIIAPDRLIFIAELLGIAFLVKIMPSLLFRLRLMNIRLVLQTGILLSSRLSLIVAAATIGIQQGYIDQEMKDAIILLALLSCLIGPTLFKSMQKKDQD